MFELSIGLMLASFVAGLLMFLAPCTLPLVPAFLAFISGVKQKDFQNKETKKRAQRLIIINAVTFTLGFSIIFIIFGVLAGLFGSFVGQFRSVLSQVGGVFIITFGLMMLNIVKITPLLHSHKLKIPSILTPGRPDSAFIIGSIFALGWTPCVGPVLASVLLLASISTTALSGGVLLTVFSLGLSIPFLTTAFLYSRAAKTISRYVGISKWVSVTGGVFLIFIGVLLLTGNFILTVEYGYQIFNFFGIEGLYDLL